MPWLAIGLAIALVVLALIAKRRRNGDARRTASGNKVHEPQAYGVWVGDTGGAASGYDVTVSDSFEAGGSSGGGGASGAWSDGAGSDAGGGDSGGGDGGGDGGGGGGGD